MKDRELQRLGLYQIGDSFVQISVQEPGDLQRAQNILRSSRHTQRTNTEMEKVELLLRSNGIILSDLARTYGGAEENRHSTQPQRQSDFEKVQVQRRQHDSVKEEDSQLDDTTISTTSVPVRCSKNTFQSSITNYQLSTLRKLDDKVKQDSLEFQDSENCFKQVLDQFYDKHESNQFTYPIITRQNSELSASTQHQRDAISIHDMLFRQDKVEAKKRQQSIDECLKATHSSSGYARSRAQQAYYPELVEDKYESVYQNLLKKRAGQIRRTYPENSIIQRMYEESLENNRSTVEKIQQARLLNVDDLTEFTKHCQTPHSEPQPPAPVEQVVPEVKQPEQRLPPPIVSKPVEIPAPVAPPPPQPPQVEVKAQPPPPPVPASLPPPPQLPSLKPPPPLGQSPQGLVPPPPPPPPAGAPPQRVAVPPPVQKKVELPPKEVKEPAPEPGSLQEMIQQQIKKMKAKRGEV